MKYITMYFILLYYCFTVSGTKDLNKWIDKKVNKQSESIVNFFMLRIKKPKPSLEISGEGGGGNVNHKPLFALVIYFS